MIKIADVVKEILYSSEIPLTALAEGYLNLSAYAKVIKPEVERRARKQVRLGSIVVSLARLADSTKHLVPVIPALPFQNVSVRSGLVEIAYDKTRENRARLERLYRDKAFIAADVLTLTQGIAEISIVVPEELKPLVFSIYRKRPKLILENLCSLTVRLDDHCIVTPNIFYSCLRHFALQRINIVEIISTFTELTLILDQDDLNRSFATINKLLRRGSAK